MNNPETVLLMTGLNRFYQVVPGLAGGIKKLSKSDRADDLLAAAMDLGDVATRALQPIRVRHGLRANVSIESRPDAQQKEAEEIIRAIRARSLDDAARYRAIFSLAQEMRRAETSQDAKITIGQMAIRLLQAAEPVRQIYLPQQQVSVLDNLPKVEAAPPKAPRRSAKITHPVVDTATATAQPTPVVDVSIPAPAPVESPASDRPVLDLTKTTPPVSSSTSPAVTPDAPTPGKE